MVLLKKSSITSSQTLQIIASALPVIECLRPIEFDEALLCSEMETDKSDPIELQAPPPPRLDDCDLSCNEPFDMSASDEFVRVDNGLVLLDPNELSDCLCLIRG